MLDPWIDNAKNLQKGPSNPIKLSVFTVEYSLNKYVKCF